MDKSEFSCPNCGKEYTSEVHFNKHVAQCAPGRDMVLNADDVVVDTTAGDSEDKPETGETQLAHAQKYAKAAFRVDDLGRYLLMYCKVGLVEKALGEITMNHKVDLVSMFQLKNRNVLMAFKRK